ncbi:MAG: hypothetical protein ACLP5V_06260 [Candidatus Bathyarchaeia archaeon]
MASKILDHSEVQSSYRITLTAPVRKLLKVREGDLIAFVLDNRGNVVIKKAEVRV